MARMLITKIEDSELKLCQMTLMPWKTSLRNTGLVFKTAVIQRATFLSLIRERHSTNYGC